MAVPTVRSEVRVKALMSSLRKIHTDCLGESKISPDSHMKGDNFLQFKDELVSLLTKTNDLIKERKLLHTKNTNVTKQAELKVTIYNNFQKAKNLLTRLEEILNKQKKKGNIPIEELQSRTEILHDLNTLIDDAIKINSDNHPSANSNNRMARDALAARKQFRENEMKFGKNNNVTNDGLLKQDPNKMDSGSIPLEPIQSSQAEAQFLVDAQKNDEEMASKLDLILQGTRQLHDMADNFTVELQVEDKMLTNLSVQVDKADQKFKIANVQMKKFLDENGGGAKWCCIIGLLIILVALLGASYQVIVKGK